jgi:pimeloyl-ACP methyl ester carboxylesterase
MSDSVPFAWRADRVRAGGVTLATFATGSRASDAPVVLLLHGLGHWSEAAWGRIVPLLDPALRYVALDLPGFGASEKPAAPYDTAYFLAALEAAVAELDLRTFALVGHSLGGFIAAEFAGAQPERISRLALISPAGFSRTPRYVVFALASVLAPWLFTRPPSRSFVRRTLEHSVADPAALDPAVVEQAYELSQEPGLRKAFAAVYVSALRTFAHRPALHAGFARYRGPVFCAWGARDRFTSPATLRDVVRIYPQAQTLLLPRSAHLPMIEEPAALAGALRAFLASTSP